MCSLLIGKLMTFDKNKFTFDIFICGEGWGGEIHHLKRIIWQVKKFMEN